MSRACHCILSCRKRQNHGKPAAVFGKIGHRWQFSNTPKETGPGTTLAMPDPELPVSTPTRG